MGQRQENSDSDIKFPAGRRYTQVASDFGAGVPACSSSHESHSRRLGRSDNPAPFGMAHGPVGAGPKSPQLPVTALLPPVQPDASGQLRLANRVALLDVDGMHIEWLEEEDARRLVRQGKVEVLGTKRLGRAVRALPGKALSADERLPAVRSGPARRHYSHNLETADNPAGVWTLVRIPKRERKFFEPPCKAA